MTLEDAEAVVIVFTLEGCGHCEEFRPVLTRAGRDHPDVVVVHIDATNPAPDAERHIRRFEVTSFPTTVLARRNGGYVKREGALTAEEVARIFRQARAMQQGRA